MTNVTNRLTERSYGTLSGRFQKTSCDFQRLILQYELQQREYLSSMNNYSYI